MWAEYEPKAAKFEEIGAEFCVFKSNAPGLKFNFCEPYVDMPSSASPFSCVGAFLDKTAGLPSTKQTT